jgi:S1-C subfamily serine protease
LRNHSVDLRLKLPTKELKGSGGSYYRQEFNEAKAGLDRLMESLSREQSDRAKSLAERWPNVPDAGSEIATAPNEAPVVPSRLSNHALANKLSASIVLVLGRTKNGLVTGSGFWVAPGILISNRHVVENVEAGNLFVIRAGSSRPLAGTVVATTRMSDVGEADIAAIRVPVLDGMAPLSLSPSVVPLMDVVAGGFPGFAIERDIAFWTRVEKNDWTAPSNVLTSGQVSSIQHPRGRTEIVMHTAPIYNGHSGGPLVDRCGRVVGINTYRHADPQALEVANFAISAGTIMVFLRDNAIPFTMAPGDCS